MNDSERPSATSFPLTNNLNKVKTEPAASPPPKRAHPFWTFVKWTLATCFALGCLMTGTVLGLFWENPLMRAWVKEASIHPFTVITAPTDPLAVFKPELQLPADKQHVVTVLLLGCDVDYERARPVPIKGVNGRSDAILVARVDFDNKSIKVISIPRDTAVRIPARGLAKINAAHALGGPALAQETIKSVFGIETDYYATINFTAFQKIVDAVGGVDLTVHKKLNYDDNWANLHIHLKPGYQHLTGYQAMGYVRMRHSDSDLMRAQRQQEFLEALRQQVKSPATFWRLPDALNALTDNLKSDMTPGQLLTLANFARQIPREQIRLETLPCLEGPSYVYINVPKSEELIREMFYGDSSYPLYIDAPSRATLRIAMNRRASHGRRKGRHAPAISVDTPKDDNGEPLLLEMEPSAPAPDTSESAPPDEPRREEKKQSETESGGSETDKSRSEKPKESDETGGEESQPDAEKGVTIE